MRRFVLDIAVLIALAGVARVQAAGVVVVGDSWGYYTATPMQNVFDSHGYGDQAVVNAASTIRFIYAETLSSPEGLAKISDTLNANPDADLVHLSIGGNDFLRYWRAENFSPEQEAALFDRIVQDTEQIGQHILSHREDIEIFMPAYDYIPPVAGTYLEHLGTPPQLNAANDRLVSRQALVAATDRWTAHDTNGLMQIHYGVPSMGIPPFDPSLPDPDLPGPAAAFRDLIHLTEDGYTIFSEENYDYFYKAKFIPEPSALVLLAMGAVGLLAYAWRRRRRR